MTPDDFVTLAKAQPAVAEKKIIMFVSRENERFDRQEISAATVGNTLKAIRTLLDMNDVTTTNWKKIRRILPKARRYAMDRTPTLDEIQQIVEAADIRGKPLTLVFISSGIREGAIQSLKVRDYTRLEKKAVGRLVVYNGAPERYTTFMSSEACTALDKYLAFRREHGEMISPESPLFRDKFDPLMKINGEGGKAGRGHHGHTTKDAKDIVIPMTPHSIRQYYNRLLFSLGIRSEKKRRHEFSVHSLRKYFKTRAEQSGMLPINVEILMGHSVGISDSYYRPTEQSLLEDYLKAVDKLTIFNNINSQVMIKISESHQALASQMESKDKQIRLLEEQTVQMKEQVEEIRDLYQSLTKTLDEVADLRAKIRTNPQEFLEDDAAKLIAGQKRSMT